MVVRREKKHRKFRGFRTYHGSHKKWRGGGSRGGRGMAGLHKHKWSYVTKYDPDHFGKHGFKSPQKILQKIKVINLKDLEKMAERLLNKKLATKEGDAIKIDVAKLGYQKVLGAGMLTKKLVVEAKLFSEQAKKKLEEAGGKAIVTIKEKVEPKKEVKLEAKEEKPKPKKEEKPAKEKKERKKKQIKSK
jgi:large subunit ribosomal protein L15